jgi:superfamily II DNA or RNA helicase
MFQLFDFQKKAVLDIKEKLSAGESRILLQSATGSGKSIVAGSFSKEYLDELDTSKILVLLNLQVLIGQTYDTFKEFGILSSVLHDEVTRNAKGERFPLDYNRRVLITMPETFINTRAGQNQLTFDQHWEPTLILIDEAHKGTSQNYQIIREMFPNAIVLGLTATPYREKNDEGEHLTEWYGNNLIVTVSVQELIDMGRLVQPVYLEFDADSHVVETWLATTADSEIKSTIVFTKDTNHSVAIMDAFRARGITAEVITSVGHEDAGITQQTPNQRQEIYNRYNRGEVDVLISVTALCEGFDSPRAKFCFLCRTVGNHALFHQMLGRVLRFFENKSNAIIVDFCGNLKEHGPIEHYQWSLDAPSPSIKHMGTDRRIGFGDFNRRSSISVRCTGCNHVYDIKRTKSCVHCGMVHGVMIVGEVGDIIEDLPLIRKADKFSNAKQRIATAIKIRDNAEYRAFACKKANQECGADIFDLTTLTLKPQYSVLEMIALENKMLGDKIAIAA